LLRFSAPLVLVIALLGAAPASAGLGPKQHTGQTRLGVQTSSRTSTGSCSATAGLLTDLVLKCDDSRCKTQVTYTFMLPKKAGSVTWQVNGAHRGATVSAKRTSKTQFRVTVTQDNAGLSDIVSVTIEYYV
jgi:hypothetical protein